MVFLNHPKSPPIYSNFGSDIFFTELQIQLTRSRVSLNTTFTTATRSSSRLRRIHDRFRKNTDPNPQIAKMPSAARRRRTVPEEESDSGEERRQTQTQSTQRGRRRAPASEDDEDEDAEEEGEEEEEEAMDVDDAEPNPQDQVVKKLVRYALACEYQRVSIKRAGITEKGAFSQCVRSQWLMIICSYWQAAGNLQARFRWCATGTQA